MILFVVMGMPQIKANAEDVGYAVRAVIPDNQVEKNQTYFDLRMTPEQKQTIKVEIYNSRTKDMNIDVYITNPITNRNGLIDYTDPKAIVDKSLKVPITKIASMNEKTVKVPAKGSITVPIQLDMPKDKFDGIILGGIYFVNHDVEKTAPNQQITNKYGYVIGLKLSETDKKIIPSLHLTSVKPGLVNYRPAVIANIQNSAPVIVNNLSLNAKIYSSNGAVMDQKDVNEYRMAPNTTMPFAIDWKENKLTPGKYTLKLQAKTGKQKWDWTKEFVIPGKEANNLNKNAVTVQNGKNYVWYLVTCFAVIIFILLAYIYKLRKKINPK